MALTRITKGVIKPNENYDTHNINSTGIVTATKFVGPFDDINVSGAATFSGNVSIAGTLTYEDVTNVDSVGIITARDGIHVGAGVSVVGILTASVIKSTNLSSDRVVFTTTGGQLEASGNLTYNGSTLASGSPFDLNADLDVDGHTNLDNVSISGITTFTNSAGVGDFKPIQLEKSGTTGASRIQFLENGTNKGGITYSHDNNRVELIAMSGNDIVFYSGGNLTTRINSSGHVVPGTDSTYDLGLTGTRFRNVYADTLYGDGSNLTGIAADKIFEGNTEVETIDTGSDGHVKITTEGTERLRIGSDGTLTKYLNSSSTPQVAFGGTGQINGITGLPSMAGSPLVVGRDTGSLRSASFGGNLNFTTGYGIQGTEFSVYGNTDGLYLNSNVSGDSIRFQTHNGSSIGERLRISSDGRVQIAGQNNIAATSLTHRLLVRSQNDSHAIAIAGRNGDHIGELTFYQSDASTRMGEIQAHTTHLEVTSRLGYLSLQSNGPTERVRISANELRFNSTAQQIHLNTSDGSDTGYLNIGAAGGANNQNRAGQMVFYGNEASGNQGKIGILAGNSGSTNGYIYFQTGGSEKLRITSGGQVNIGNSLSQTTRLFTVETTYASGGEVAYIGNNDGSNNYGGLVISAGEIDRECRLESAWGNSFFTFHTQSDGAGAGERLRIAPNGNVLIGDGNSVSPTRHFEVRGSGHQQILLGSTNNAGASLMVDGHGGGDGSGGNYGTFEMGSDGNLDIRNYDPAKSIIFGTGSNTGSNDRVTIASNGKTSIVNAELAIESSASYTTHLNYNNTGINYISSTNGGATYFRGSSNSITALTVKGDGEVELPTAGYKFTENNFESTSAATVNDATAQFTNAMTSIQGSYHSSNNGDGIMDFTDYKASDWNILDVYGRVNPNRGGSGAYSDPFFMTIYKGVGYTYPNVVTVIFAVMHTPAARTMYSSGTGASGNDGITAVWYNGSSESREFTYNNSNNAANYLRIKVPTSSFNTTYGHGFTARIFKRF